MTTEQYSIGYEAGYQDGFDAALAEPVKQEPVATDSAKKDAVFEASIQFIKTLTGMEPPPIEIAPTEVFAPFREFTEKVCKVFAAPPNVEQEPVAWMCWIDSDEEMNPANAQLTSYEPKAYAKRKPLYAAPQPVKQEPVAFKFIRYVDGKEMAEGVTIEREKTLDAAIKKAVALCPNRDRTVLVCLNPVRTKDLTPYEITALIRDGAAGGGWQGYARAVIAKFKEKNK